MINIHPSLNVLLHSCLQLLHHVMRWKQWPHHHRMRRLDVLVKSVVMVHEKHNELRYYCLLRPSHKLLITFRLQCLDFLVQILGDILNNCLRDTCIYTRRNWQQFFVLIKISLGHLVVFGVFGHKFEQVTKQFLEVDLHNFVGWITHHELQQGDLIVELLLGVWDLHLAELAVDVIQYLQLGSYGIELLLSFSAWSFQ